MNDIAHICLATFNLVIFLCGHIPSPLIIILSIWILTLIIQSFGILSELLAIQVLDIVVYDLFVKLDHFSFIQLFEDPADELFGRWTAIKDVGVDG